mmetsp:Transcript_2831/g.6613  ORF Transcript_2831/g.6613 Transcript_2831/m.6613 type:complete len:212 (-) Transcript_2831:334-969(-)
MSSDTRYSSSPWSSSSVNFMGTTSAMREGRTSLPTTAMILSTSFGEGSSWSMRSRMAPVMVPGSSLSCPPLSLTARANSTQYSGIPCVRSITTSAMAWSSSSVASVFLTSWMASEGDSGCSASCHTGHRTSPRSSSTSSSCIFVRVVITTKIDGHLTSTSLRRAQEELSHHCMAWRTRRMGLLWALLLRRAQSSSASLSRRRRESRGGPCS